MGDLYSLVDPEEICGYMMTLPNKVWQKQGGEI